MERTTPEEEEAKTTTWWIQMQASVELGRKVVQREVGPAGFCVMKSKGCQDKDPSASNHGPVVSVRTASWTVILNTSLLNLRRLFSGAMTGGSGHDVDQSAT